jgi:hypothetical protein
LPEFRSETRLPLRKVADNGLPCGKGCKERLKGLRKTFRRRWLGP